MRLVLAVLLSVWLTVEAQAISRYTSTSMTCAAIQNAIDREGAVILRYRSKRNPSLQLYGRYVSDFRFCQVEETSQTAWVPARDTASCPVLECVVVDFDDDYWRYHRGRR